MKAFTKYSIYIVLGLGGLLGACNRASTDHQVFFAVFPHFTMQSAKIGNWWQKMAEQYNIGTGKLTILIISPDHFGETTSNNQTYIPSSGSVCFQGDCVQRQWIFSTNPAATFPQIQITKEHWRGAHFRFINRYFPGAQVILLKTVPRNLTQMDSLLSKIQHLPITNNLLVLASVDFSHYTSESFAKLHDRMSRYTLNTPKSTISDFQKLEVDCPSCLYLTNTRARNLWYTPQLMMRDSSSTLMGNDLGTGNTSRQIIFYTTGSAWSPWITLGFAGDLIFDRGVSAKLSTPSKITQHFQDRFQFADLNLRPETNIHRKWFGIDLLWFNLETPIVASWESCTFPNSKLVNFCSSETILPILSQLGRNVANLANNHSLDAGLNGKNTTESLLLKNNISSFGDDKVEYRTIRGIKVALHGYTLLDANSGSIAKICTALDTDKAQNNKVILSLHRGKEYASSHSPSQEGLAKYFIDCGADVIIGHHPHVIQDIQRYKGKPIIYSLGNFLFDQATPATQTGMIALLDIPLSGQIQLWTGMLNTLP